MRIYSMLSHNELNPNVYVILLLIPNHHVIEDGAKSALEYVDNLDLSSARASLCKLHA